MQVRGVFPELNAGLKAKKKGKMAKVMSEFKAKTLRSGSKTGPKVTNHKQAVAIALSEARSATGSAGRSMFGARSRPRKPLNNPKTLEGRRRAAHSVIG